jgi:hypothetical protein
MSDTTLKNLQFQCVSMNCIWDKLIMKH